MQYIHFAMMKILIQFKTTFELICCTRDFRITTIYEETVKFLLSFGSKILSPYNYINAEQLPMLIDWFSIVAAVYVHTVPFCGRSRWNDCQRLYMKHE